MWNRCRAAASHAAGKELALSTLPDGVDLASTYAVREGRRVDVYCDRISCDEYRGDLYKVEDKS